MGTPADKVQFNVYIPEDINEFVEHIKTETGLNKSEFTHLVFAYFRRFASPEDIKALAESLMLFGEEGLEKVA